MNIFLVAMSEVEVSDKIIWIKFLSNKLSDLFISLKSLFIGRIEKLILCTSDKKNKVIFERDKVMSISYDKEEYLFLLNEYNIESIECLIIDFWLQIAFPSQHLDMELNLIGDNAKYDCIFQVEI